MEVTELEERTTSLENQLKEKEEALNLANKVVNELKESKTSLEKEVTALSQLKAELEGKINAANETLKQAVGDYRGLLLKSAPEVMPELVSGETIAAVNESLEKAKTLVNRVRQGIQAEIQANRVPAGSPARTLPDLSHLSPREKISYAVSSLSR